MKNIFFIPLFIFSYLNSFGSEFNFINELISKYNIKEENAIELDNEFKNNNLTIKDQSNFIKFINNINKISTNYINYDNIKIAIDVYRMCKENIEGTQREREREMLRSFFYVITQNKNQNDSTKNRNLYRYQFKIKQENRIKYHKGTKEYYFENYKFREDGNNLFTNNQNNRNQNNRGRQR